jgi:hypothetical protein
MVTGPVQKSVVNDAGIAFSGHTEFLAERCGSAAVVMLLVADDLGLHWRQRTCRWPKCRRCHSTTPHRCSGGADRRSEDAIRDRATAYRSRASIRMLEKAVISGARRST